MKFFKCVHNFEIEILKKEYGRSSPVSEFYLDQSWW